MIFTDRTITVRKGASSIDDPIVLYRGDKEVEIRFTLNESLPFKFGSGASPNIIEKTEAAYGQLVIKTPNDLPSIFSEIVPTNEGKIVFTITAEMIDEITEVGNYTFQIRLLDESMNSRATLPEVVNGIEIREPIATEDVSTTNEVGVATVGYALTTAGTTEDTFDSQGNYNKTIWGTGDRITAAKLNKIEAGIDGVNKKIASGGTGSGGVADSVDWSNIQNKPTIPTKTSQLTNDSGYITSIPDEYITEAELNAKGYATTSQIPTVPTNVSELTNDAKYASEAFVSNKIAEAQLGGEGSLVLRDIETDEIFTKINSGGEPSGDTTYNMVTSASQLNVNEDSTNSFTIKLDNQPTSDVTINIATNNEYCTIDKNSIIFTSSNYNIEQTVTVSGVHDSTSYNNKTSVITISSTGLASKTVSVTIVNVDINSGGEPGGEPGGNTSLIANFDCRGTNEERLVNTYTLIDRTGNGNAWHLKNGWTNGNANITSNIASEEYINIYDTLLFDSNTLPLAISNEMTMEFYCNLNNFASGDIITGKIRANIRTDLATGIFNIDGGKYYADATYTDISLNTWLHFVLTVNSTQADLYVNGNLQFTTNAKSAISFGGLDINLTTGILLKYLRFYNTYKTNAEITEMYNNKEA